MSDLLLSKLSAVRGKHTLVAVATGCAVGFSLLVSWSIVAMWLDREVPDGLPRGVRALSMVLLLMGLGYVIFTRVIRPITKSPDDEEVALMIERQWPEFLTRFIAAIQFTKPDAAPAGSPTLVRAMVKQAEDMAEETQVTDVVATRTLNRSLLSAAILCVLGIGLFLWAQPASGILLTRFFLSNDKLPTKTQIADVSGDMNVAIGDSLKITATVTGYRPASGKIEITYGSGRYEELPMEKDPNTNNQYEVTLDSVLEKFTYRVKIYDGHSDTFTVAALERPAIAKVEMLQVYPAYTEMGTQLRDTGDLTLLAGSRLKIKVTATKPLRITPLGPGKGNYVLRFVDEKLGHSDTVALVRSRENPYEATLETPEGMTLPTGLNALSIHLIDTDDLESKDTAVYPVEIVPDRPPTVRIMFPLRKEELATAAAKFEVGFTAEDDILLGKLTLHYKVGEGDAAAAIDGPTQSITLPLAPKTKSLRTSYLWDLSQIPVPAGKPSLEGSVVEYWIEAEDTNNISGPGKGMSEHYSVRIVTREEKTAEMAGKSAETFQQVVDTEDAQRNAMNDTNKSINGDKHSVLPPPPP